MLTIGRVRSRSLSGFDLRAGRQARGVLIALALGLRVALCVALLPRVVTRLTLALALLPGALLAFELAELVPVDGVRAILALPGRDQLLREADQVQGPDLQGLAKRGPIGTTAAPTEQSLPGVITRPVHHHAEAGGAHGLGHPFGALQGVVVLERALVVLDPADGLLDGLPLWRAATLALHGLGDPIGAGRAQGVVRQVPDLDHTATLPAADGVDRAGDHVARRTVLGAGATRAIAVPRLHPAGAGEEGGAFAAHHAAHPVPTGLGLAGLRGLDLGAPLAPGLELGDALGLTLGALAGGLDLGATLCFDGLAGADLVGCLLQALAVDLDDGPGVHLVAPVLPLLTDEDGVADDALEQRERVDAHGDVVFAQQPVGVDAELGHQGGTHDDARGADELEHGVLVHLAAAVVGVVPHGDAGGRQVGVGVEVRELEVLAEVGLASGPGHVVEIDADVLPSDLGKLTSDEGQGGAIAVHVCSPGATPMGQPSGGSFSWVGEMPKKDVGHPTHSSHLCFSAYNSRCKLVQLISGNVCTLALKIAARRDRVINRALRQSSL